MADDALFVTPTTGDASRLAALMRQCFTATFGHLYAPRDLATFLDTQSADAFDAQLADPAIAFQLACVGAEPVGFAKLGPVALPVTPQGPAIELRQFYLVAGQQGTGLAHRLMDWVLTEARARGARELFLSVYVDNHRARRFYERLGFARVGAYAFMVGDHTDEDDLMRLAL